MIAQLAPELLTRLFYDMLRIRLVEERIAERYPEQEMRCPVHLCIGQEAVAVGVCANLTRADSVLSGHRSHGHYLAKGGDLQSMLAELYGRVTGCSRGKGGSMHLVDLSAGFMGATPIVGSTIPIAVGVALKSKLFDDGRVTVVFFGEGATEEGVFHESLNFAALKRLPVVFVCENNLYSVYSPLSVRQPAGREVYEVAAGHGIESSQGDGNDVLTVYQLSARAIEKARHGGGPTFLEFKTYRWREHCGPFVDHEVPYRSEAELEEWRTRCPIAAFEHRLLSVKAVNPSEIAATTARLHTEIDDAFRFARKSAVPSPEVLLADVYAGSGAGTH